MLFIIFIVFILIIIFFIKNREKFEEVEKNKEKKLKETIEKIKNINKRDLFTNQKGYRLGDGFYETDNPKQWERNTDIDVEHYSKDKLTREEIIKMYPDSILTEYFKKSNLKRQKYNILANILKTRLKKNNNQNINPSNSCLIHLRLGDIIDGTCDKDCFVNKFYFNKDNYNIFNPYASEKRSMYINSKDYLSKKISKLHKYGINNLHIICGAHVKLKNYDYSNLYLNEVIDFFKENNFNIELKYAQKADDDLLFSLNFDYFIPSNGQYSRLITDINKYINHKFKTL